jgi:hypothetical protein
LYYIVIGTSLVATGIESCHGRNPRHGYLIHSIGRPEMEERRSICEQQNPQQNRQQNRSMRTISNSQW